MIKSLAILGSTGSIGTQALEVCKDLGIPVSALIAGKNIGLLAEQIRVFRPKMAVVSNAEDAKLLALAVVDTGTKVYDGKEAMVAAVCGDATDMVLTAVMGSVGIAPTVAAIAAGKKIALANKETLVAAGSVIMPMVEKYHTELLPVDSEHAAIFQCLAGNRHVDVEKLILTASGGPFRGYTAEQLEKVTKADALKHPNWSMGSKITIDSASMMNKGLEVIEAHWLFGMPAEKIDVVIHPQSIIHSMVAYHDGSVMAQMGAPDMRLPIQMAFTWPERPKNTYKKVDFLQLSGLTFELLNTGVFRCLALAYTALAVGGTTPAAMNAANEVAVAAFLANKIPFFRIADVVEAAMQKHTTDKSPTLLSIENADIEGRVFAEEAILKIQKIS